MMIRKIYIVIFSEHLWGYFLAFRSVHMWQIFLKLWWKCVEGNLRASNKVVEEAQTSIFQSGWPVSN